jgi:hypothetical protein
MLYQKLRATLSAANRLFKALASVTPLPSQRAILPPQALSVQAIIPIIAIYLRMTLSENRYPLFGIMR